MKLEIGVIPSIRIEDIWVGEVARVVHVIVDSSSDKTSLFDEKFTQKIVFNSLARYKSECRYKKTYCFLHEYINAFHKMWIILVYLCFARLRGEYVLHFLVNAVLLVRVFSEAVDAHACVVCCRFSTPHKESEYVWNYFIWEQVSIQQNLNHHF